MPCFFLQKPLLRAMNLWHLHSCTGYIAIMNRSTRSTYMRAYLYISYYFLPQRLSVCLSDGSQDCILTDWQVIHGRQTYPAAPVSNLVVSYIAICMSLGVVKHDRNVFTALDKAWLQPASSLSDIWWVTYGGEREREVWYTREGVLSILQPIKT